MIVEDFVRRGGARLLQSHAVQPLGVRQRGPVLVVHDGEHVLDGGGGMQRPGTQVLGSQRQAGPEQVERPHQQHEALAAALAARHQLRVAARRRGGVHEGGQRGAARVGQLQHALAQGQHKVQLGQGLVVLTLWI